MKFHKNVENSIVTKLQYISTWKLLVFTFFTLGVYLTHYIKRQTNIINKQSEENDQISESFIMLIVVVTYLYMGLLFAYIALPSYLTINIYSFATWEIVHYTFIISYLIWGFRARNRMNRILSAQRKEKEWFHGFWSIIFVNYYFNFKINKLKEFNDLKSEMT